MKNGGIKSYSLIPPCSKYPFGRSRLQSLFTPHRLRLPIIAYNRLLSVFPYPTYADTGSNRLKSQEKCRLRKPSHFVQPLPRPYNFIAHYLIAHIDRNQFFTLF